jgi:uncharacterized protein YjaG (DUF416 family)
MTQDNYRPNAHKLRLINEQLRAIDAVPLLSDDAAALFQDEELENAVKLSKRHLLRVHQLVAEHARE